MTKHLPIDFILKQLNVSLKQQPCARFFWLIKYSTFLTKVFSFQICATCVENKTFSRHHNILTKNNTI